MTRKQLKFRIFSVIGLYMLIFIFGLILYNTDTTEKKIHYQVFKDLIPFTIAIPAAYLGFCFQSRSSYLQTLRQLWTNLIAAVNSAILYTHLDNPSSKEYGDTLTLLSISIDEVRGVYKNLKEEADGTGYYPFESLKSIHQLISDLGYENPERNKRKEVRQHIKHNWKNLRQTFLQEFDRAEPTIFDSPFIKYNKNKKPDLS